MSAAAAAKSLQSCLTLCDPINGSPPGSSVPGILQARTLEWVASSFSNAWKWKVKVKSLNMPDPMDCSLPGSSVHGISQARIMEWVAISFSRGSSLPKDWILISCIGRQIFFFFFYHWAIREAPEVLWTPSVKVFMEASLHRCDWLNHWPLVINSDSSSFHPRPPTLSGDGVRRGGACWKFQPSKETSLLPISSILRGCPKVRSLT